jgi:hypothetical protein
VAGSGRHREAERQRARAAQEAAGQRVSFSFGSGAAFALPAGCDDALFDLLDRLTDVQRDLAALADSIPLAEEEDEADAAAAAKRASERQQRRERRERAKRMARALAGSARFPDDEDDDDSDDDADSAATSSSRHDRAQERVACVIRAEMLMDSVKDTAKRLFARKPDALKPHAWVDYDDDDEDDVGMKSLRDQYLVEKATAAAAVADAEEALNAERLEIIADKARRCAAAFRLRRAEGERRAMLALQEEASAEARRHLPSFPPPRPQGTRKPRKHAPPLPPSRAPSSAASPALSVAPYLAGTPRHPFGAERQGPSDGGVTDRSVQSDGPYIVDAALPEAADQAGAVAASSGGLVSPLRRSKSWRERVVSAHSISPEKQRPGSVAGAPSDGEHSVAGASGAASVRSAASSETTASALSGPLSPFRGIAGLASMLPPRPRAEVPGEATSVLAETSSLASPGSSGDTAQAAPRPRSAGAASMLQLASDEASRSLQKDAAAPSVLASPPAAAGPAANDAPSAADAVPAGTSLDVSTASSASGSGAEGTESKSPSASKDATAARPTPGSESAPESARSGGRDMLSPGAQARKPRLTLRIVDSSFKGMTPVAPAAAVPAADDTAASETAPAQASSAGTAGTGEAASTISSAEVPTAASAEPDSDNVAAPAVDPGQQATDAPAAALPPVDSAAAAASAPASVPTPSAASSVARKTPRVPPLNLTPKSAALFANSGTPAAPAHGAFSFQLPVVPETSGLAGQASSSSDRSDGSSLSDATSARSVASDLGVPEHRVLPAVRGAAPMEPLQTQPQLQVQQPEPSPSAASGGLPSGPLSNRSVSRGGPSSGGMLRIGSSGALPQAFPVRRSFNGATMGPSGPAAAACASAPSAEEYTALAREVAAADKLLVQACAYLQHLQQEAAAITDDSTERQGVDAAMDRAINSLAHVKALRKAVGHLPAGYGDSVVPTSPHSLASRQASTWWSNANPTSPLAFRATVAAPLSFEVRAQACGAMQAFLGRCRQPLTSIDQTASILQSICAAFIADSAAKVAVAKSKLSLVDRGLVELAAQVASNGSDDSGNGSGRNPGFSEDGDCALLRELSAAAHAALPALEAGIEDAQTQASLAVKRSQPGHASAAAADAAAGASSAPEPAAGAHWLPRPAFCELLGLQRHVLDLKLVVDQAQALLRATQRRRVPGSARGPLQRGSSFSSTFGGAAAASARSAADAPALPETVRQQTVEAMRRLSTHAGAPWAAAPSSGSSSSSAASGRGASDGSLAATAPVADTSRTAATLASSVSADGTAGDATARTVSALSSARTRTGTQTRSMPLLTPQASRSVAAHAAAMSMDPASARHMRTTTLRLRWDAASRGFVAASTEVQALRSLYSALQDTALRQQPATSSAAGAGVPAAPAPASYASETDRHDAYRRKLVAFEEVGLLHADEEVHGALTSAEEALLVARDIFRKALRGGAGSSGDLEQEALAARRLFAHAEEEGNDAEEDGAAPAASAVPASSAAPAAAHGHRRVFTFGVETEAPSDVSESAVCALETAQEAAEAAAAAARAALHSFIRAFNEALAEHSDTDAGSTYDVTRAQQQVQELDTKTAELRHKLLRFGRGAVQTLRESKESLAPALPARVVAALFAAAPEPEAAALEGQTLSAPSRASILRALREAWERLQTVETVRPLLDVSAGTASPALTHLASAVSDAEVALRFAAATFDSVLEASKMAAAELAAAAAAQALAVAEAAAAGTSSTAAAAAAKAEEAALLGEVASLAASTLTLRAAFNSLQAAERADGSPDDPAAAAMRRSAQQMERCEAAQTEVAQAQQLLRASSSPAEQAARQAALSTRVQQLSVAVLAAQAAIQVADDARLQRPRYQAAIGKRDRMKSSLQASSARLSAARARTQTVVDELAAVRAALAVGEGGSYVPILGPDGSPIPFETLTRYVFAAGTPESDRLQVALESAQAVLRGAENAEATASELVALYEVYPSVADAEANERRAASALEALSAFILSTARATNTADELLARKEELETERVRADIAQRSITTTTGVRVPLLPLGAALGHGYGAGYPTTPGGAPGSTRSATSTGTGPLGRGAGVNSYRMSPLPEEEDDDDDTAGSTERSRSEVSGARRRGSQHSEHGRRSSVHSSGSARSRPRSRSRSRSGTGSGSGASGELDATPGARQASGRLGSTPALDTTQEPGSRRSKRSIPRSARLNLRRDTLAKLTTNLSALEERRGHRSLVNALTDPAVRFSSKHGLIPNPADAAGEVEGGSLLSPTSVFSASRLFSPNGKRRPRTGLLGGASTVTRSFAPPVTSLTARALLPLSSILKEVHAADEIEGLLCSELNDQIARLKGVGAQYRRHLATVRERNMSALPAHIAGGLRDPLIKATGTLRHADGLLPDADTRLRMLLSRAFVGGFERAVRDASMAVLQFEHALGIAVAALDELTRQQRERAAAEARRKAAAEAERALEEAEAAAAAAALAKSEAAATQASLAASWDSLQSGIAAAAAAADTSRSDSDGDDDWSPTAMKPLDHRLSAVGLAQAPYIIESGDADQAEQDRRPTSVVGRGAASTPAGTAGLRGLGSPVAVAASPTVSHYWRLISPQAVGAQSAHRQQRSGEFSASRSVGHGRSRSDGPVEAAGGDGDNCAGSATLTASDAPSFMPLDARLAAAAPVTPPPAASAHSPPPDTSRATVSQQQQQRSVQLRSPLAAVRWAQSRGSLHAIEERSVDTSDGDGDGADAAAAAAAAAAGSSGSARQQAQATARTDTSRHGSVTVGSSSLPPSVRQQRGSLIRSPTVSRVSAGNLSVDDGLSMLDAVEVGPDDSASCLGVFARKAQTALESHSRDVTLATSTQALAGVGPSGGVVAVDGHVRMPSHAHQAAVPQPTSAPPPPPALGSKAAPAAAAAVAVASDEVTPVVVADSERPAAGPAAPAATSPEKRQLPSLRAVAKAAVFASTFVPGMLRKKTAEGGDADAPKRRRAAAGGAAGGEAATSPSSATGVGAAHTGPKTAWLSADGHQTAEDGAELLPHPPSRGILSPSSQAGGARGAAAGAGTSTNASSGRGTATGGLAVSSVTSPTQGRSVAAGSAPFVTSPTATERERQLERELEMKNAQLQAALSTAAALSAVVQASQAGGDGAGASTARSAQNSGRRSSGAGASAAAGSAASGGRGASSGAAAASAGVGGRTRVRSPRPVAAEESEGETGREALAREEASYVLALEHILLAKRAAHKLAARTRARRVAAAAGTESSDAAAAPRKQAPPPLPTREPISPAEGRRGPDAPGSGRRPRSPASAAREATVSPSAAGDRHSHRSPQGHHRQQQSGGSSSSGAQAGRGAATVALAASKLLRLRSSGQAAHVAAPAAGPSPTAAAAGGVLHIPTPGRSDGRALSSTRGAAMHSHPASPANANGSFGLGGSGPISSRGGRDQPSARAAVDGVTGLSGRRGFFKSASEEESFLSGLSDEDGAVVMTARDGARAHAPSGSGGVGGASTRDGREALQQQRPLSSTRGGMRGHGQAGSGVVGVSASLAAMASEGGLIPKPLDSTRASMGPGSGRGGGYSHPLSTRGAGPSGGMAPTASFRVTDGRHGDRSSRSQEPTGHVATAAAAAASKGRSTSNARGGGAGSVAPSVVPSAVLSGSGRRAAHHRQASSAASAAPTASPGDVYGDGRRASGAAGVPASTFTVSAPGSSRPVSVVIPSGGSIYPGSPGVPGGSNVLALPQPAGAPQAGSLRSVASSAAMHLVPVMLDGRTVYLPSAAAAEYAAPPAGYMYSTSAASGAGTGGAGGAYMTTMPGAPGPLLRSVSSFAGMPGATVQVGPASVMGMQPPSAVLPTPRGGVGGAGALTGRSQAGSSRVASYLAHDNELRLKASGRPKLAHQPSAYDLARARETLGSDGPAAAAISVTDSRMHGGYTGVDASGFSPTHGTASYVSLPAGGVAVGGMPYMGAVGGPTGIYSGAAGVPGMLPRAPTVMLLQPGAPGGFAAVGTTSAAGSLGYVSSVSQSTYAGAGGMPIGADMSALGSGRVGGGHMSLRSLSRQATAVSFLMKNRAAGDPQHSVRSSDRAITPPPNIKRAIL